MYSCIVCCCSLGETRWKNLKEIKHGKNGEKTLADLVTELVSTSNVKAKAGKLAGDHACLSCFRELSSLSELQQILSNKQTELLKKLTESRGSQTKNGKKKRMSNDSWGVLHITKEAIPIQNQENSSPEGLSLQSIISMDAEITITEKENGGTEIDFEVVEGISDLKRANELYGCRFCKKEFVTSTFAINHMQEIHGKLLHKCDICEQEFRLKCEIDQHRISHLKDAPLPFQCGSCHKGFETFEAFQEHDKLHELQKKFGCAQCGRKFDDENKLNHHMLTHQYKSYACNRCNKTFRSNHSYIKHQKLHGEHSRFSCNLCSRQFASAENLHTHLKKHNKPHKCDVCSKAFDSQLVLEQHLETHSKHKKNVECTVCGKLLVSQLQLESHMRVHTGEKPYQCDACGATFAQRSNLDSHHRAVHLQERRFKCDECDKTFKRKRLLQYHIRSVHTGERPYNCEICHATFVYPEHYKKHLLTHSGIKPWACEICGKTFSSKDNRNSHRFTHSDRKPYECQVCGLSFMRKPALLQHLTEERHGDPETAGAAVKIVQVLTGHEMEPESHPMEWDTLEIQSADGLGLGMDNHDVSHVQTIIIPDEHGRPIEIQVVGSDSTQQVTDQLQFELSAESLNVIQAFELQGGNVDDTLAALM
ncbi:zinc finger protein 2 [Daphnia magna]|uniref:zinc finger protein 2 n=1 Tax=Daphnia magna TaxID=35525 RepID=UPI001E1BD850|nr:zinc finger protein 2 [Daphnia magna]